MSKHTHLGTCQVCEHVQAVNSRTGRLAKHGYTVDFHVFNGTCWGSGELPYEKDCELVKQSIARANEQREATLSFIARVEAMPAGTQGFIEHSPRGTGETRFGYRPTFWYTAEFRVDLNREFKREDGSIYTLGIYPYCVITSEGSQYGIEVDILRGSQFYGCYGNTAEQYAAHSRKNRIVGPLRTVEMLDLYIAQQTKRVNDWKLTDLIPKKS